MKKAYWKEMFRAIKKSKKRFLSIVLITALGITVLTGIYAACQDMYKSADRLYDEQNLFDIKVVSTLGLTDDDLEVLSKMDGIEDIVGSYNETVKTEVNNVLKDVDVSVLNNSTMNELYLLEGKIPTNSGEIAVTQAYLNDTGKSVGDEITIKEIFDTTEEDIEDKTEKDKSDWNIDIEIEEDEETPTFPITTFTISGIVIDPMDISNSSMNFRTSNTAEYTFFISSEDANYDVYTAIYITLAGLDELNCFSDEYKEAVQKVIDVIETEIKEQREQARYDEIYTKSQQTISDAETTMNENFEEVDKQLSDAGTEIERAMQELNDGATELAESEESTKQQLNAAQIEIDNGKALLIEAEAQIAQNEFELDENAIALEEATSQLTEQRKQTEAGFEATEQGFTEKQIELNTSITQLSTYIEQLKQQYGSQWPEDEWNALVSAATTNTTQQLSISSDLDSEKVSEATINEQNALLEALNQISGSTSELISQCIQSGVNLGILNGSQKVFNSQKSVYEEMKATTLQQFANAESEIEAGKIQIEIGRQQIVNAKEEIAMSWVVLEQSEAELNTSRTSALHQIANAWTTIQDGQLELTDAKSLLIENEQEYQELKEESLQKITDAYAELEDIDMTTWYIQDRTTLESFSDMQGDIDSIETIGNVFPIVFLIVAVLISLTTMTRMVEEERSLIGTYKALGFSDGAIYLKYLIYAFLACILGGVIGDLIGFIILPKILLNILSKMYVLPNVYLNFDVLYGVGGVLLFAFAIVVSTAFACRKELSQVSATLMRPKAPSNGSRIILERLSFVWNRLRFLNKVTARNLFRYKKRMFMTVFGIMGCTALVLCGFAIKDSVSELLPKQYTQTYLYDLMAVTTSNDNDEFIEFVSNESSISDYINLQIESFEIISEDGSTISVTIIVIPADESINDYIDIRNTDGKSIELDGKGIYITQNAAELLSIDSGSFVTLENSTLDRQETRVTEVVQNYLGNNVYIEQELYESLYGAYEPNGVLANLTLDAEDQGVYAESLLEKDYVISSVSIEASKEAFSSNFTLLNAVVYLLIILAAGLAIVVLFTLSNTNISERNRELATIKVLGFFDLEVHAYVNKETLILTSIGILIGLPVGRFLSGLLTSALKISSLYFDVYIAPSSYLIAVLISFAFALIVNLMTNKTLDRIDMVEALKSVE